MSRRDSHVSRHTLSFEQLEARRLLCHGGRPPHVGCGDDPPPEPPAPADPAIVFIGEHGS